MKVTIEVDCTPEEARAFLGLPDVKPMQEEMTELLRDRLRGAAEAMDPDALMKSWFAMGTPAMDAFRKMMTDWSSGMAGGPGSGSGGGTGGSKG